MEERGQAEPWTPPQRCKVKWSRVGPRQWWGPRWLAGCYGPCLLVVLCSITAMSSSHDISFSCHCLQFILWSPLMKPFIAMLGVGAAFSLGPSCGVQGWLLSIILCTHSPSQDLCLDSSPQQVSSLLVSLLGAWKSRALRGLPGTGSFLESHVLPLRPWLIAML